MSSFKFVWYVVGSKKHIQCNKVCSSHSESLNVVEPSCSEVMTAWQFINQIIVIVIDFDSNQKCVCDLLLVINNNHGCILHYFRDMAA